MVKFELVELTASVSDEKVGVKSNKSFQKLKIAPFLKQYKSNHQSFQRKMEIIFFLPVFMFVSILKALFVTSKLCDLTQLFLRK